MAPVIYTEYTGIANWKEVGGLNWHAFKSVSNASSAYHSFGPGVDGPQCLLGGGHRGGFEDSSYSESLSSGNMISLVDNYLRNMGWVSGVSPVDGATLGSITNSCGTESDMCWDKTSARAATVEVKVNWEGCIDYPRSKSECTLTKKINSSGSPIELGSFHYRNTGEGYYPTEYKDTIYVPKVGHINKEELDLSTAGSAYSYSCDICNYAYIEMTGSGALDPPDRTYMIESGNDVAFAPSESGTLIFTYSTDVWSPVCCESLPSFSGTVAHVHEHTYFINDITVEAFCPENPICQEEQLVKTLTDYYEDNSPLMELSDSENSHYKVIVSNDNSHQVDTSVTRYSRNRNDGVYYDFNHGSLSEITIPANNSGIFDKTNSIQISNYPHSLTKQYHDNYFLVISDDSAHSNSIRRSIQLIGDKKSPYSDWHNSTGILFQQSGEFLSDFSSPILHSGENVSLIQSHPFDDCGERVLGIDVSQDVFYSPVNIKVKNTSDTKIKVGVGAGVYTHFFGVSESTGGTSGNRAWKSFSTPEELAAGATSTVYLSDKNPDWFVLNVIKEYSNNGSASKGVEDLYIISEQGRTLEPEVIEYIKSTAFSAMPTLSNKNVHEVTSAKTFDSTSLTFEYVEEFTKVTDATAILNEPNTYTIAGENSAFQKYDSLNAGSTVTHNVSVSAASIPTMDAKHVRFVMTQGEIKEQTDTFTNSAVAGYGYNVEGKLNWTVTGSGSGGDPLEDEGEGEEADCADLDIYISTNTPSSSRIVAYYNTAGSSSAETTSNSYGDNATLKQVEDIFAGCDCATSGPPEVINGIGFSDSETREFKTWWNVYTASCQSTLSGDAELTFTVNNTGSHSIYVATGDGVWTAVSAGGSWSNDFSQYEINANGTQDAADSSYPVGLIQISGGAEDGFTRTGGTPKYYSYGHFSNKGVKTTSTLRGNSHWSNNGNKGGPSYHVNHYASAGVIGQLSSITDLHNFDVDSSQLYGPVKNLNYFDVFVDNGFAGEWEGFTLTYEATYGYGGYIDSEKKYVKNSDMNIEVYSGKHTINVS